MAYIIIFPDPDWRHRCRHISGDPDCACYPECPECGATYSPREGHDCINSDRPVSDLVDIARELRDALDACETERDRLRAQIAALQAVPQGVEVPELVYSHEESSLVRCVGGDPEWDAAVFGAGYNLAKSRARLAPTPPQAAPGAVVRGVTHAGVLPEDSRPGDLYWERGSWREWKADGPMVNASSFAWIRPFPALPQERRVGPPGRAAWLTVEEMADAIYSAFGTHYMVCMDYARAIGAASILKADRLRTSAQAHSGEESK